MAHSPGTSYRLVLQRTCLWIEYGRGVYRGHFGEGRWSVMAGAGGLRTLEAFHVIAINARAELRVAARLVTRLCGFARVALCA